MLELTAGGTILIHHLIPTAQPSGIQQNIVGEIHQIQKEPVFTPSNLPRSQLQMFLRLPMTLTIAYVLVHLLPLRQHQQMVAPHQIISGT